MISNKVNKIKINKCTSLLIYLLANLFTDLLFFFTLVRKGAFGLSYDLILFLVLILDEPELL